MAYCQFHPYLCTGGRNVTFCLGSTEVDLRSSDIWLPWWWAPIIGHLFDEDGYGWFFGPKCQTIWQTTSGEEWSMGWFVWSQLYVAPRWPSWSCEQHFLTFLEYTHVIPCSTLVSKDGRAITHLSALCSNCMIWCWCCIDSHCHVRSYMIIWTNGFRCLLFCMPQRMITLSACRLTEPTSIQQSKDCDRQSCRCCCCCVLLLAISALWVKIDIEQPMVGNHLYHAGFLWAWKSGIPGLPGYP